MNIRAIAQRLNIKDLFPYILLSILTLIVFSKIITFEYIYFDDNRLILGSSNYLKNFQNVFMAFSEDIFHGRSYYYRPIFTLSLLFDTQLCGLKPICFHATNLLLHIFFVSLLYTFIVRLGITKYISLFLAAIFAVHPIVISDVAWINGRIDILVSIFSIAMFVFFDEWLHRKKLMSFLCHIVFLNLAIYTKEIAFPFIVLMYFYYIFVIKKSFPKKIVLTAWIISISIWAIARYIALQHSSGVFPSFNFFSAITGLLIYTGKIIPISLSLYPIYIDSNIVFGIITLIMLFWVVYLNIILWKKLLFFFVWYLLLIIPATVKLGNLSPVYLEYRLYLPLVGVLVGLGFILTEKKYPARIIWIIGVSAIFIFSIITFKRLDLYKNEKTFWDQAVLDSPHSDELLRGAGWINQYIRNNPDKAAELYKRAIDLNANIALARPDLAKIYIDKQKFTDAESLLKEDLNIRKTDYAYLQIGRLYYAQHQQDKALSAWKQALALNPNYLTVNINLAIVNADLKNFSEAKKYYLKSIELGGLTSDESLYLHRLKYLENY